MRLLNASGMTAGYTMGLDKEAREHLVVVVKGTFDLPRERGAEPRLADAQLPLVDADSFTGAPGFSATLVESDWAPVKPRCDVLLNGAAYAPQGRPAQRVVVGLQLGAMQKAMAVCGPRAWEARSDTARPGPLTAFERQPIAYDLAFGGTDTRHRDPAYHGAYVDNPVGRGWHGFLLKEFLDGAPMPSTEAIGEPVQRPDGRYRPMAFGPVSRNVPARLRHAGTYDQDWQDNVFPFLPADFDTRYFQAAPEDQQVDSLQGGERVLLVNLTPDGRREFPLPAREVPVVFFRRRADRVETRGTLDTVSFEPEAERFTMTWRCSLKLERDIFEVTQVVVGRMSRGWWRAMETGKTYHASLDSLVRERAEELA